MFTEKENAQLQAIWEKHQAKDYWGDADMIAQKIQERDQHFDRMVREQNETGIVVEIPTDAVIETFYHYRSQSFVHKRYAQIQRAVKECDIAWLTETVRYDQKVSLELYEMVTGQKVKGLSNKKLAKVFAELAYNAP